MRKGFFSKLIIVLVVLLNIAFTYRVLEIFAITGIEPIALIGAWFGFTMGELLTLASIKKKKINKEE